MAYSLNPGNQREPDMLAIRGNKSVRYIVYTANKPAREYPAIPLQLTPCTFFSVFGMISFIKRLRYSSAPPVQEVSFEKIGGVSHGAISCSQSKLLIATSEKSGHSILLSSCIKVSLSAETVFR